MSAANVPIMADVTLANVTPVVITFPQQMGSLYIRNAGPAAITLQVTNQVNPVTLGANRVLNLDDILLNTLTLVKAASGGNSFTSYIVVPRGK